VPKGGLSAKQKRFCDEYIIDLNATQAYIRAGYSAKGARVSACKSLTNANIQAYIQERLKKREKRTELSQDYVINGFRTVAERCIQEVPVMAMEHGELVETGEYKFDSAGANTAFTRLGQHLGMFKERGGEDNPIHAKLEIVLGTGNLRQKVLRTDESDT